MGIAKEYERIRLNTVSVMQVGLFTYNIEIQHRWELPYCNYRLFSEVSPDTHLKFFLLLYQAVLAECQGVTAGLADEVKDRNFGVD